MSYIAQLGRRCRIIRAAGENVGVITLVLAVMMPIGDAGSLQEDKNKPQEAPTSFNNSTNGFEDQAAFDADRRAFEEVETILPAKRLATADYRRTNRAKRRRYSIDHSLDTEQETDTGGLGPIYNATSCVACHQNPVTGSSSQVTELRAGHHSRDANNANKLVFLEPPGGSLIHQRAIDPQIQEHVRPEDEVRTLRISTNILGNGFVEVIPDKDILDVRKAQPAEMRGLAVEVPVAVRGRKTDEGEFEFEFAVRLGRFGWKCQEASLINFSAGAYLNEMGITSPLQPKENSSGGRDLSQFDQVLDPEDGADPDDPDNEEHPFGEDVKAFARFMRSTKAPPRDFSLSATKEVQEGEKVFKSIGCAVCHHPTYSTPKANTAITSLNLGIDSDLPGSDLGTVPPALGNKVIHPYSDFLLHDVGTGDGIAQTQHAQKPPEGSEKLQKRADNTPHSLAS